MASATQALVIRVPIRKKTAYTHIHTHTYMALLYTYERTCMCLDVSL